MTVSTQTNFVTHTGNGIVTAFPYTFRIPEASMVSIIIQDKATGDTIDTLVPGEYTITGIGWDGAGSGIVNYPLAGLPLDGTKNIVIQRLVPYTQGLDIKNQSGFYPESVENQLDLMVMQIQQLKTDVSRAVLAPIGYDPNDPNLPGVDPTLVHSDFVDLIVKLSQAEYNALATKNPTTLYLIVG